MGDVKADGVSDVTVKDAVFDEVHERMVIVYSESFELPACVTDAFGEECGSLSQMISD